MAIFAFVAFMHSFLAPHVFADEAVATAAARRLDILRYGIESQVIELLSTLGREKNDDFKEQILKVFDASTSPKLKASILDYMGILLLDSATERAIELIKDRDEVADSLVGSAFSYLLLIKSNGALPYSLAIVKDGEKRYLSAAIKMIGAVGADDDVKTLKDLYEADGTDDAVKEQVVLALGTMKAKSSYDLLANIASSSDASMTLRMYACSALGSLGDPHAIPVLIGASTAPIPNVRAYAIAALGGFTEDKANIAVREALRDPHVLVRIAAAKAVAKSLDGDAIPYLEFKVSDDPEKAVREASIEALAEIGGRRAESYLAEFIADTKKPAQYRGAAFGALIKHGRKSEIVRLEALFKTAQAEKDRAYFTILAKALVLVDNPDAEPFIALLLDDRDFQMRLGAIAWIDRNKSSSFKTKLRTISESDSTEAVKRRAAQALERLGS